MDATQALTSPLIALKDVVKVYTDGQVRALDQVSLQIDSGEFVAITGPSGCGKSTLLNVVGALDHITSGEILFKGQSLQAVRNLDHFRAREIGFVFQTFYLLPNLTAEENVQIPMFESELGPSGRARKAQTLLDRVGLAERKRHLPRQLSIGQRQRVAIARAIANDPAVILADEPTGALDSSSGGEVMELLAELNAQQQSTLVVVTHDDGVASQAGRILRMRDGRFERPC